MKFDILFTETYDSIKYKDKLKTALIYLIPNISKKILNKIDSAYYQHVISVNGSDENVILFSKRSKKIFSNKTFHISQILLYQRLFYIA
jgi:hypothetical protein